MSRKHPVWKFWWWFGANPTWDFIKFIGGTAIMSALWNVLKNEIHRHPVDWILFAGLLVFGCVLIFIASWKTAGTQEQATLDTAGNEGADLEKQRRLYSTEIAAERRALEQCEENLLENQRNLRKTEEERSKIFTPLQFDILMLTRDLRKLRDDAGPAPNLGTFGPMPKGEDVQAWIRARMDETGEWTESYSAWARKMIYRYQQGFSDRVKNVMVALGADTGLVVISLEPYTKDVRPGYDFQNLIDILLEFFIKLETSPREHLEAESLLRQDQETLALYEDGIHTDMMRKILEHPKMGTFLRNAYQDIDEWKKQNEAK